MVAIIIETIRNPFMQNIIRPKYIKQIAQFVDKPVIKVLTGMRRVGKSTLLTMIKDEILKNIPQFRIGRTV